MQIINLTPTSLPLSKYTISHFFRIPLELEIIFVGPYLIVLPPTDIQEIHPKM